MPNVDFASTRFRIQLHARQPGAAAVQRNARAKIPVIAIANRAVVCRIAFGKSAPVVPADCDQALPIYSDRWQGRKILLRVFGNQRLFAHDDRPIPGLPSVAGNAQEYALAVAASSGPDAVDVVDKSCGMRVSPQTRKEKCVTIGYSRAGQL